jgi:hypothetical protein
MKLTRNARGSYSGTYRGTALAVLDVLAGHGREWTFTLNGHYASDTYATKREALRVAKRTVDSTASDFETV